MRGRVQKEPASKAAKIVVAAITWIFVAACAERNATERSNAARVDAVFAQWDRPDSPGCAVSVSRDGDLIFSQGYGSANLDHGVPNTADTVFHVASLSKQFTAAAIALLALDGALSLDDDVREYVPELPDFGATITIRNLLHHTSGIRDQWELLILNGWRYSQDLITDDDVMSVIAMQKHLNFMPGERHLYSNSGYTLLARIVERVSGRNLRRFANERLFAPVGMQRTFFRDNFREVVAGQAYGYVPVGDTFELGVTNFDTVGATSLLTTANDLARWAGFYGAELVGGSPFVELMAENGRLNDGSEVDYAFGTVRGEYRGLDIVEHSGSDAGYTAHFMRFPAQRTAIACLCNVPADASGLARRMADIFLAGALSPAVGPRDKQESEKLQATANRETGSAQAGYYWHDELDEFLEISATDSDYHVHNWGMVLQLHPLSKGRFRVGGYGVILRFLADHDDLPAVELDWGNGEPVTYAGVSPVAISAIERSDYVGSYSSDEIGVPYQVIVDDAGTLYLEWPKYYRQPLRPGFRDVFFSNNAGTIRFSRNADEAVEGFQLSRGRSRGINFDKR